MAGGYALGLVESLGLWKIPSEWQSTIAFVVLFLVLPFGVKNAAEEGEAVEPGNEAGAPVNPRLVRKAIYTTILATVIFALVYGTITRGWITLDSFPS